MRYTKFIGIDPDTKGAVCVLDYSVFDAPSPDRITFHDTPTYKVRNTDSGKNETMFSFNHMAMVLAPYRNSNAIAVIEQMKLYKRDYPTVGILIEGYGAWQMACAIMGIPFVCVLPDVWKQHHGVKRSDKEHAIFIAKLELEMVAHQITTHGRADAALQAKYGRDHVDQWLKEGRLLNAPEQMRLLTPDEQKRAKKSKKAA